MDSDFEKRKEEVRKGEERKKKLAAAGRKDAAETRVCVCAV